MNENTLSKIWIVVALSLFYISLMDGLEHWHQAKQ